MTAPYDPVLSAMANALRSAGWECIPPSGEAEEARQELQQNAATYLHVRATTTRLRHLPKLLGSKDTTTVGDLVAYAANPRPMFANIGKVTIEELRDVLRRDGLYPGDTEDTGPSLVMDAITPETLDMNRVREWVFGGHFGRWQPSFDHRTVSDEMICEAISTYGHLDNRRSFLAYMAKGAQVPMRAIGEQEGRSPERIRQRIYNAARWVRQTVLDRMKVQAN